MNTTWPSPLQMQADKRAGKTLTIGLPDGRQIRLSTYVSSWQKLLMLDPSREVANWTWFPVSAARILHEISHGVHDRINQHLPKFRSFDAHGKDFHRVQAKLTDLVRRGLLRCECSWCGQPLRSYQSHNNRFCDRSCRRSYY